MVEILIQSLEVHIKTLNIQILQLVLKIGLLAPTTPLVVSSADKLGVEPKDAQKRQVEARVVFCEEDKDEGVVDVSYQTIYDEGGEVSREDIELEEGENLMIQRVLTGPRVEKESECTTNL